MIIEVTKQWLEESNPLYPGIQFDTYKIKNNPNVISSIVTYVPIVRGEKTYYTCYSKKFENKELVIDDLLDMYCIVENEINQMQEYGVVDEESEYLIWYKIKDE